MTGPDPPTGSTRPGGGAAWAELLRLPLGLTVAGDLAAGAALGGGTSLLLLGMLFLVSLSLYLGGMALNDLVDRAADRHARPGRPLPAGRIPVYAARRAVLLLFAAGLGGAWALPFPLLLSLCLTGLALAVVLYDLGPRRLAWWGPLLLGLCRGLDLAAAGLLGPAGPTGELAAGAGLFGLYGALVTWQAAGEEGRGRASLRPLLPLVPLAGVPWFVGSGGLLLAAGPLLLLLVDALLAYGRGRGAAGARRLTGVWIGGFLLLGAAFSLGREPGVEGGCCLLFWLLVRGFTPPASRS